MQFIDLKAQYARISVDVNQRIQAVLNHGQYIMGPELTELENKLAEFVGVKHVIGVSDGSTALLIALMALGIQAGDEVITTPFTFIATGEMIALLGAKPVFVDIDPQTYNIDVSKIEAAITSNTKAIMPVSLYGLCADFDAINAIAAKYQIAVIEDGAQSFGASYKGKKSCGLTTIGCTSFFPSKPLGCYGDGGACFTNDDELAKKMREIRVHGQDRRYHHPVIGLNGRLDTLQAAILLAKLAVFPKEVEQRAQLGARYSQLLADKVRTPVIPQDYQSVYAQFTVEVEQREKVVAYLQANGIPSAIHYPIPLHLQPAFANLGLSEGTFPVAEAAAQRVMSLPMYPDLSVSDQDKVVGALIKALG
ncbi:MAG: DegT/DnrJ/EryC1/StrS family aminotransferase [Pseudomonadales bacterium]|nr:DegT/DnrJ/EryC1/StrS family aminotransferase [Pseudomonadales bacterium]